MKTSKTLFFLSLVMLFFFFGCSSKSVRSAPSSLNFYDANGKTYNLGELASTIGAVVLVAHKSECPIVRRYSVTLEKLNNQYSSQKVRFYYINSFEELNQTTAQLFIKDYKPNIQILSDKQLEFSKAFGVERTTEVVVLTSALKVIYRGAIDDRFSYESEREPTEFFLKEAIEAALQNRTPARMRTQAVGCLIE
jgi:peroxiredoxin